MSRKWKSVASVFTGVAAVGAFSFLSAAPASAASCAYAQCNGLSAAATGCEKDAVTKLDLITAYRGYYAELRWSPSCHAFWTRITPLESEGGDGAYGYIAGGKYGDEGQAVTQIVYTSNRLIGERTTKMISQAYAWERFCAYGSNTRDVGCKITTL